MLYDEFRDEDIQTLGVGVAAVAEEIFKICAGPKEEREDLSHMDYDFCVQEIHWDWACFGSTNRLMWRPATGWSISESHCTERFIRRFKELDLSKLI